MPLPSLRPLARSRRIQRQFSTTTCCFATHYQTLQVPEGSSKADIKSAFHKLSKRYHPDSSSPFKSATKFAAISEAYTVLGDDTTRRNYDQSLNSPFSSGPSSSSSSGYGSYGYYGSPNEARRQSATYAWQATQQANARMRNNARTQSSRQQQTQQQSSTADFNARADAYARMHPAWGTGARMKEEAARAAAAEATHAVGLGKKIGQIVSICFLIYLLAAGTHVKAEELEEEEKKRRIEEVD